MDEPAIPSAHLRSRVVPAASLSLLIVGILWFAHHLSNGYGVFAGKSGDGYAALWVLVFASLAWHLGLAWAERPITATDEEQAGLDELFVTLNVPCYNEDPAVLRLVLQSVLRQSRPVDRVQVVNDGSTSCLAELRAVESWWRSQQSGTTRLEWINTTNAGKRRAQLVTFADDAWADIFATMDSDTILDSRCVEEGLKPFAKPQVTSVASIILAYNNDHWFVRLTDTWLLAFQLVIRSALSRFGSVLVNSGNFSMYRADVLRAAADAYPEETFAGRHVDFSDDSLLTLYAHLEGRTVQQPSSFAFSVMPETVGHHVRQQLRWMRGSTIRSIWRFKYLPLNGIAYWEHFAAWVSFVLVSAAFVLILIVAPLGGGHLSPAMAGFGLLVCYATALKYLTIARSDQTLRHQLLTYALAPVMLCWTAFALRPLRFYAIATCHRTGWGTRSDVEVTMPSRPSQLTDRG